MKDAQPRAIYLKDYQAPDYWIDTTDLTFDLFEDHALVTSVLGVRRNEDHGEDTPELTLVGIDLELVSVCVDDTELTPAQYIQGSESLTVPVASQAFSLTVVTRIRPQENTSLEGLYKSNGMFCTQCEAEGFRKITYYLDRPDVMSKFTTKVIADKGRYPVLLSNGNDIARGEFDGGRHWVTWEDPFKKPSYLFALVGGDLEVVEDTFTTMSGKEVALRIFTESHNIDKCDHAMVSLKKSMKWDEEVYGREYDLDIFMIVAVDHFNMGAMENKGLNIFNSSCVLASPDTATDASYQRVEAIVAHEYFHNWSGNRVTCRDWFQLSLKEGFTVFRDAEFSADMNSRGVKRIEDATVMKTAQFAEDAGPMAHPIRPQSFIEISNFYTLTVYEKGCEVVRMIQTIVGKDNFRKGSDLYFDRHDGEAATCEDFVKAMEDASGVDLSQFRNWYNQAGTPVITVTDHFNPSSRQYSLTIGQSCPATPGQDSKLPFHIPVAIALLDQKGQALPLNEVGETEQVLQVTAANETWTFDGLTEKPLPSILRNFSAPVRVNYDYRREDLVFLMKYDSDGYNRWDAGQRLATEVIQDLVKGLLKGEEAEIDSKLIEAFGVVLADEQLDKAVKTEMLRLPTEASLAEQAEEIHPLQICEARSRVRKAIAVAHKNQIQALYQTLEQKGDYSPEATEIAERTLRNTCLGYLSELEDDSQQQLAVDQYRSAGNMTDLRAAMSAVINSSYQSQETIDALLNDFLDRYKNDSVVMDSWFMMQSASPSLGTLEHVKSLLEHASFDSTSPNKLRALLGGFASGNMKQFHSGSGEGYEFLADWIITLDKQNPQTASRLMTPLTRWKKYEPVCREHMRKALERIKAVPDLSTDIYEVVTKSL
ncbi:aminopeptidase N [Endozoicomonas numazuensis]|uniref:Aminopeptidase N n=1 Tax=Endozoicomonas numazuensis TaxID=1137799 RepID=A0A081NDZ0_9GAMM|nr:aminopeptidase N [Endozoicomonas numazuensis]KEQ16663.1 aminopeptidase N [Endozoicomonas numazuensis]